MSEPVSHRTRSQSIAKRDEAVRALAAELRNTVGSNKDVFSEMPEFWARKAVRDAEPDTIQQPEEYKGGEHLSIICTQTDLLARDQRELVDRWCKILPTLSNVSWLWFHSRVPQELFDAACRMPQLVGLYVKWSGITRLNALADAERLEYLKLGSSPSIQSIDPLPELIRLKWLQIDNVRVLTSADPLRRLTNLEGLGITGAESKNYTIDSFEPLANLSQLTWLHLGAVHTRDKSLRPLANLKQLAFLGVANVFPVEEFAALSLSIPPSVCHWAAPFARFHPSVFPCARCKANWKVMPSGLGARLLCPTCDSLKLARHVMRFNEARDAARER